MYEPNDTHVRIVQCMNLTKYMFLKFNVSLHCIYNLVVSSVKREKTKQNFPSHHITKNIVYTKIGDTM